MQTAALQSTGVYWIPLYDLQLANVISNLSVVTGQMIVRAVVAGERDLQIQASRGEIAKSLEGNGRQELLFVLQQEIEMYDPYQRPVTECDQQLQPSLFVAGSCSSSVLQM